MNTQKTARLLKGLVSVTIVCNLFTLLLVPGLARLRGARELSDAIPYFQAFGNDAAAPLPQGEGFLRLAGYFLASWREVWLLGDGYTRVLTAFLLLCGGCTAVILWQARRVLDTILAGEPFSPGNAANMTRAAGCCLLICLSALARLLWGLAHYRSLAPLLTYNALFVPVFAMGFLLCMVMSALFRRACELKAENDLTI